MYVRTGVPVNVHVCTEYVLSRNPVTWVLMGWLGGVPFLTSVDLGVDWSIVEPERVALFAWDVQSASWIRTQVVWLPFLPP